MNSKTRNVEGLKIQEELTGFAAITETWWDKLHNWVSMTEDYKIFRRKRQFKRRGGVAFYIKKWINFEELQLRKSQDQVECF